MNGAQGGGYGQQYGQRSMPYGGNYGGSYGGGGMFGQQGYGQQRNFGQNYGSAFGGQPRMQSQTPPQTGLPPWANQNVGGAQNPYSTVPMSTSSRGISSGSGMPNFNFGQSNSVNPQSGNPPPSTGGQDYAAPMDSAMPYKKPMMLGPQTGGQDYSGMQQPNFPMPGQTKQDWNAANPGGYNDAVLNMSQNNSMQPPQSWEQQNAQLLRPAQMQDPALAQQTPWGSPTAQSLYPGLNPQQLARVNQIGSNPGGGGAALNDYLLSIRYPGALQPGQPIIR
jgi:hypothetical protein